MPSSTSKSSKPKPSDVASEAKKTYIPWIRKEFKDYWPTCSRLLIPASLPPPAAITGPPTPSQFQVSIGDPVDMTLNWMELLASQGYSNNRIPLICAANERRAGGDWETGVVGYEERLCRRSNLSATLSTPDSESNADTHYPIPIAGGIYSPHVVVFRGPHDRYELWESPLSLPVISVTPTRWPKLTDNGTKYSFAAEKEVMRAKMRAALRIAIHAGAEYLTIGDFGLGNGYRNPPQEMAEMWRETFLYEPDVRGRIKQVMFIFEDQEQCTIRCIAEDMVKKAEGSRSKNSKSKSSSSSSHKSSSSSPTVSGNYVSDVTIFQRVFDEGEISRVVGIQDPRYGINMLTS